MSALFWICYVCLLWKFTKINVYSGVGVPLLPNTAVLKLKIMLFSIPEANLLVLILQLWCVAVHVRLIIYLFLSLSTFWYPQARRDAMKLTEKDVRMNQNRELSWTASQRNCKIKIVIDSPLYFISRTCLKNNTWGWQLTFNVVSTRYLCSLV